MRAMSWTMFGWMPSEGSSSRISEGAPISVAVKPTIHQLWIKTLRAFCSQVESLGVVQMPLKQQDRAVGPAQPGRKPL